MSWFCELFQSVFPSGEIAWSQNDFRVQLGGTSEYKHVSYSHLFCVSMLIQKRVWGQLELVLSIDVLYRWIWKVKPEHSVIQPGVGNSSVYVQLIDSIKKWTFRYNLSFSKTQTNHWTHKFGSKVFLEVIGKLFSLRLLKDLESFLQPQLSTLVALQVKCRFNEPLHQLNVSETEAMFMVHEVKRRLKQETI